MTSWTLADVEEAARAKLERMAYDYAAGGAGEEVSLRGNVAAYHEWRLRPRMLVDVASRDLSVDLLGRTHAAPFGIAPTAFHRLFHPDGERGTARAAAQRNILHCVSTIATTRLEEVAEEGAPRWFQLYVHRDRALTGTLVDRAKASGYEALVLTVDVPVQGVRERDQRNRFFLPDHLSLANMEGLRIEASEGMDGLSAYIHTQFDPSLTWDCIEWLRERSGMPVLVKGVLTHEDARLAVEHGAAGVIVSNHGARQLDRVPATLDALPEVVAAVGDDVPVIIDGGVRRGVDAIIAIALGARFVMLGRQIVWGLAAGGSAGVGRVLDLFRGEVDSAMALCGKTRIADLGSDLVIRRS